jgi:hypothetical protein
VNGPIEEVKVAGVFYRGPMPTNAREGAAWKITAMLPSAKIGTGGQRVGFSWQTWRKFETEADARRIMGELKQKTMRQPGGAELIAAERERQIRSEGFTAPHDDKYICGELANAAAVYAMNPGFRDRRVTGGCGTETVASELWSWDGEWWKPKGGRIRQLVKAGALIAAEIDRLQRAGKLS